MPPQRILDRRIGKNGGTLDSATARKGEGAAMAKSLHEQAAEYVRARIVSGEYPVGSQIPTENELCALLGVSRPTLRQALDNLTREGLLVRIKGKGTFVSEPKVMHESTSFITGYRAESEKNHRTLRTCVLYLGQERAGEAVAHALELPLGARVTRLVRLRHLEGYRGDAPVVYTTRWILPIFPFMMCWPGAAWRCAMPAAGWKWCPRPPRWRPG